MKILFVDHEFHRKTRSSNFFLDLLRATFQVDVEYIDVENSVELEALDRKKDYDLVVIWQLDFLAPAFLSAGYRTVVVPMFDGSANMPYEHWVAMNDASFICFSRTLHERVIAAGCRSYLVKYFIAPCQENILPNFEELRGVFWMRRPQDGLTPRLIEILLGEQLSSLHVHNAPDDGKVRLLSDPAYRVTAFPVTESRWSAASNQYLAALRKANVFFAPRVSEGIGMAMLEAFANGLLVIAHDDAVHNEYVANWVNGILFNRSNPGRFHLALNDARDMAYTGWCGAVSGYDEWLDTRSKLVDFLKETKAPSSQQLSANPGFVGALWDAYLGGIETYQHFLKEHVVNIRSAALDRRISKPVLELLGKDDPELPVVDADGLFFGMSARSVARKYGFDRFDTFSACLSSRAAGFSFAYDDVLIDHADVVLSITSYVDNQIDQDWVLISHINNQFASNVSLPRESGEFIVEIPLTRDCDKDIDVMFTLVPKEFDQPELGFPEIKLFSIRLKYKEVS